MRVENNWLIHDDGRAVEHVSCDRNKYSAGSNICDYIVYHFTASTTLRSAHNTFKANHTNVSWHLTIDTDGSLYQLYDFRKRTWHAGRSSWIKPDGRVITGMNKYAIGIEMINAGPITLKDDGTFRTIYNQIVNSDDVYQDGCTGKYWHKYTDAQIETARKITPVLCKQYKCVDVLGHEEISPGRKIDPGPAFYFALQELKELV